MILFIMTYLINIAYYYNYVVWNSMIYSMKMYDMYGYVWKDIAKLENISDSGLLIWKDDGLEMN